MKFGIALPTCTEGMLYPIPFARPSEVVRVAVEAEQLGYYAVMGNDHLTTQRYVRQTFPEPPNFYEPRVTYAYCAASTSSIRFMTGVIVMPMRDPVLLAKQAATLDQFTGGRLILGLGVGAYREEFEATRPALKRARRSELVEEGMAALRILFGERRADYRGKHYAFEDVEMFPKPVQSPLPIFSAGNADGSVKRAADHCQGWIPAALGPERLAALGDRLHEYARAAGRDPSTISIAPQVVVSIGKTSEAAEDAFKRSQIYEHLASLSKSTLKGVDVGAYAALNLIGPADEICRRVEAYRAAGADHLSGLLFVGRTVDEMLAQARLFAELVMPNFPEGS